MMYDLITKELENFKCRSTKDIQKIKESSALLVDKNLI